jgi:hypothetical protein
LPRRYPARVFKRGEAVLRATRALGFTKAQNDASSVSRPQSADWKRTLFTLDWINDPDLRRSTGQELNKGEACNTLARTVLKSEQFVLSGQGGHHVGGMFRLS